MEGQRLRTVVRSPFANTRSITRKFVSRLKYVAVALLLMTLVAADDAPDLDRWDDEDDYDSVDEIVMA